MLTIETLRRLGANTQEGLGRCMNNEAFYLRLVNMALDEPNYGKLEEAVKNAYGLVLYGGGDNYEEIAVTAVRFEYVDGLPYYVLTLDEMLANGPMEARALAVDFSLIEEDGDLLAAWERQFNLP